MFEIIDQGKSKELRLHQKFFDEAGMLIQATPLINKNGFVERGQRLLAIESGRFLRTLISPLQGIIKNYEDSVFMYPEKWCVTTPLFLCQEMSVDEWKEIERERQAKEKEKKIKNAKTLTSNVNNMIQEVDRFGWNNDLVRLQGLADNHFVAQRAMDMAPRDAHIIDDVPPPPVPEPRNNHAEEDWIALNNIIEGRNIRVDAPRPEEFIGARGINWNLGVAPRVAEVRPMPPAGRRTRGQRGQRVR